MRILVKSNLLFLLLLGCVYLVAWYIQAQFYFNPDVSWLMLASQRLLSGGTYSNDFFEVNPPLILYLYAPAVLLAHSLHLAMQTAMTVYIFILASISLLLCGGLLTKILLPSHRLIFKPMIFILAALLLIYPLHAYAQREHLMILFTMPYFFLVSLRLEKNAVVPRPLAILIGFMAGLGFCIKPYFLIPLLLIEVYGCLFTRQIKNCMRPEVISIACVMVIYGLVILIRHHDYVSVVLPMVLFSYYQEVGLSYRQLLVDINIAIPVSACVFYSLLHREQPYRALGNILCLAIIGLMMAYMVQHAGWSYQLLPALVMSILLMMFYYLLLTQDKHFHWQAIIKLLVFSLAIFTLIASTQSSIWISVLFFPYEFFSLFFLLFFWLFYCAGDGNHLLHTCGLWCVLVICSLLFWAADLSAGVFQVLFFSTILLMSGLFGWLLPGDTEKKGRYLSYFLIGLALFSIPVYRATMMYARDWLENKSIEKFMVKLLPYRQNSLFFITKTSLYAPIRDFTDQVYVSRLGSIIWIPSMDPAASAHEDQKVYAERQQLMNQTLEDMAEDLSRVRPAYVFVDGAAPASGNKMISTEHTAHYFRLFLLNAAFKKAWSHYQYMGSVDLLPEYQFAVYRRNSIQQS